MHSLAARLVERTDIQTHRGKAVNVLPEPVWRRTSFARKERLWRISERIDHPYMAEGLIGLQIFG